MSKPGRKKRDANSSEIDCEATPKRVSKRSRTEPSRARAKIDISSGTLKEEHLNILIDYVKNNGFQGEYAAIPELVPIFTEHSLRSYFSKLVRWTEPMKDDAGNTRYVLNNFSFHSSFN